MRVSIYRSRLPHDRKFSGLYSHLADTILQRYQANWNKSLLDVYHLDNDFLKIDPNSLEFIFSNREGVIAILSDPLLKSNLLDLFVNTSIQFTYENNQFIHLNQEEGEIFRKLYHSYLQDLKTILETSPTIQVLETGMALLVKNHFQVLSQNISRFFDREIAQQAAENIILKKAVCSEYSPEFQLEILGISLADLMPPVLDLGCGITGQLVKYLNAQGISTTGVDRLVDSEEHLFEADWLQMDFQPQSWGTVISHMAFSNHFLFHHRYKHGHPEKYARRYMQILASLQVGGAFYYSPGLPFIERLLPAAAYSVHRREIPPMNFQPLGLKDFLKEDVWYVSRIVKMPAGSRMNIS